MAANIHSASRLSASADLPRPPFLRRFNFLTKRHRHLPIWCAINDRVFGHVFANRVAAMGIRDRPISPRSPWQNGIAERLIGTLRRECLDRMLIFGESHLRRVLASYMAYYNQARTHLALQKDAPLHRAAQRSGVIVAIPILAGLHHQYARI